MINLKQVFVSAFFYALGNSISHDVPSEYSYLLGFLACIITFMSFGLMDMIKDKKRSK